MWKRLFFAPEIIAGASRRGVFWRGVLALVLGILIALEPLLTPYTLALCFGWGMLIGGIWICATFFSRTREWGWFVYGSVIAAAGAVLILAPQVGLIAFAWCIALMLLGSGILGVGICLNAECSSAENLFCFVSYVFAVILGFLLFLFPVAGLTEMFWLLGVLMAFGGLVQIVFSFRIRAGSGA